MSKDKLTSRETSRKLTKVVVAKSSPLRTGRAADYTSGRIERVDIETNAAEVLYDSCDGVPLKGPNDIVFDTQGGF
jgi:sugar lactone lactonase YvrE